MARRPNILLLMADQHRADILGCAGDPVVVTPNIDRLAAEGTRFDQVYCQGPLCMPARASVLTERYVRDHGVFENDSQVELGTPTFLTALREGGYQTGCIGKMHLWVHGAGSSQSREDRTKHTRERIPDLEAYGFEEPIETVGKLANVGIRSPYSDYLESKGLYDEYREHVGARLYRRGTPVWNSDPIALGELDYVDAWHGRRVVEWLEQRNDDRPFFQWVGFPGPHDPWDAPRASRAIYDGIDMPMPGTLAKPELPGEGPFDVFLKVFMGHGGTEGLTDDVIQDVRRAYYADVSVIDRAVGEIVAALERTGQLDDTWIIYTSDHGEMMGEHRMLMKMVFYEPSVRVPLIIRPPGGRSEATPAVIEELVEHLDLGATFRELAGAPPVAHSEARSLLPALERAEPCGRDAIVSENYGFALFRESRHKLVVYEDETLPGQLFDLETDPLEEHDRIDDPDYAEVKERMLEERVRPFLAKKPVRPHASLIERLARAVVLAAWLVLSAQPAWAAGVWSNGGMVAASVEPAVHAGAEVLARGGNAVDAAVATAFAAGVAHQFSSGIGGGGFILVRIAETGESFAVDAREIGPAAAHAKMYLDADGNVDKEKSRHGGASVGVPGLVQGLEEVHERFGALPWRKVVAPAIRLAEKGVPIGPHHQRILRILVDQDRLADYPETKRVQFPADGTVPPLGYRLKQPDMARTLRVIAKEGARAMTHGRIAAAMVASARKYGGELTLEDLQSYKTAWREPVRGTYRGASIVSMPPPSSGGVHLIQILNTLEPFDVAALGHNSSGYIHRVAEAMKLAFADRAVHLGDPDFHPVPTQWLVSKTYGLELADRLRPRPFWAKPPWRWGQGPVLRVEGPGTPPPDDAGTTHISVLDKHGNAVALTQTVNTLFGSRITAPGTGIVLNNEMDDFSAAPDAPNAWGVVGQAANAVAPRKRPLSSMTPTIVLKDDQVFLVTGSPMGPLIITTVLQTILNVIDFDFPIQQAVSAPRFHHQWRPDRLSLEAEHPTDVVEQLQRLGHETSVRPFRMGASASILRDPETGVFWGAVDPRRDSGASGP